jgi:hypothetical protein
VTGAERVRHALTSGVPDDRRLPVCVWRAMPEAPTTGAGFVCVVLEVAESAGCDLVKVPRRPASVEPERRLADLARIVRLASDALNGAAVVVTAGPADEPEWVREAVEGAGCAGVYLPLEGDGWDAERTAELLDAATVGWCSVVHLHGAAPTWERLTPLLARAQAVSWAGRAEGETLAGLRERVGLGKCVMGGVDERRIAGRKPEAVRAEAAEAVRTLGAAGLILAPDCTPPPGTPAANVRAVYEGAMDGARV